MARFVNAQVPEAVQPFWAALQAGEFIADGGGGHVSRRSPSPGRAASRCA
jgi:hypothetical protein